MGVAYAFYRYRGGLDRRVGFTPLRPQEALTAPTTLANKNNYEPPRLTW